MKENIYKTIKWTSLFLLGIILVCFSLNTYIKESIKGKILSREDIKKIENIDAILVLGAGIWGTNPSPMLEDRLTEAIYLYENDVSSKLIMSGDHGRENYNEVTVMKEFAIEKSIPSENIFMDHAGFSSYDSLYRAKEIFGVKKVAIVTQEYHLYRALYIAKKLGIDAYGVSADKTVYRGQAKREVREVLARIKDFVKCMIKPKSTYLGESIPINGNGNLTND